MIKEVLGERRFQAENALARRKMNLLERQFEASEQDRSRQNEAYKDLRNYNIHNIDQAPADVLATIDKNAIGNMVSAWTVEQRLKAEPKGVSTKLPSADIQALREIRREQMILEAQTGQPVPIEQTDTWKIITARATKEFTRKELEQQLYLERARNPMTADESAEVRKEEVSAQLEAIYGAQTPVANPGAATSGASPEFANPTLNRALERFRNERQSR